MRRNQPVVYTGMYDIRSVHGSVVIAYQRILLEQEYVETGDRNFCIAVNQDAFIQNTVDIVNKKRGITHLVDCIAGKRGSGRYADKYNAVSLRILILR